MLPRPCLTKTHKAIPGSLGACVSRRPPNPQALDKPGDCADAELDGAERRADDGLERECVYIGPGSQPYRLVALG